MNFEQVAKLVRSGDGFTSFARLNEDSTWNIEVVEVIVVARTQHRELHMLHRIEAQQALVFLQDLIDSANTEGKARR